MRRCFLLFFLLLSAMGCGQAPGGHTSCEGTRYARYFALPDDGTVVLVRPEDARRDTLRLDAPAGRLICMSTSFLGYLEAIGCDSVVTAVSGTGFVTEPRLRARAAGESDPPLYDVGYDAQPDYERILSLHPDLYLTYSVGASEPASLAKLRSLGVRVAVLSDHLEEHPLARAEYIRLFGALVGRRARADSVFAAVEAAYLAQVRPEGDAKVLLNLPYADQWYIPGADNYLSRLIRDAGGRLLGAGEGSVSRVISLEEAFLLASEADYWLHPGSCRSREQLQAACPAIPAGSVRHIYNNTLRTTPAGGNDFWESGAARPDLVLEDLVRIFDGQEGPFHYYFELL